MVLRGKVLIPVALATLTVAIAVFALINRPSDKSSVKPEINPRKGTCPKAIPDKLVADSLAGATKAALIQATTIYKTDTKSRYAVSADLTAGTSRRAFHYPAHEIWKICSGSSGKFFVARSVEVDMMFPKEKQKAIAFVARFGDRYRIWAIGH